MRITKRQLRRIIKEERAGLLFEQGGAAISLTPMQVNFVRYAAEVYRDQILEELIGDIPTPEEQAEIDTLLGML